MFFRVLRLTASTLLNINEKKTPDELHIWQYYSSYSFKRKHAIVSYIVRKSHLVEKRDISISLIKSNLPELSSS